MAIEITEKKAKEVLRKALAAPAFKEALETNNEKELYLLMQKELLFAWSAIYMMSALAQAGVVLNYATRNTAVDEGNDFSSVAPQSVNNFYRVEIKDPYDGGDYGWEVRFEDLYEKKLVKDPYFRYNGCTALFTSEEEARRVGRKVGQVEGVYKVDFACVAYPALKIDGVDIYM